MASSQDEKWMNIEAFTLLGEPWTDAFHARARPPVQFGPVHVVEPSPSLELGL